MNSKVTIEIDGSSEPLVIDKIIKETLGEFVAFRLLSGVVHHRPEVWPMYEMKYDARIVLELL